MKKENLLKVMIIIICIIILVLIVTLHILLKNNNNIVEELNENTENTIKIEEEKIQFDEYKTFYVIEDIVNYYLSICILDNNKTEYEQGISYYEDESLSNNDKLQYIYNMLDEQYIKDRDITIDNIENKIKIYNENIQFKLIQLKELQQDKISSYVIYGDIEKQENLEKIESIYIVINIDDKNNTFSIKPLYNASFSSIEDVFIENINTQINNKINNTFANIELTDYEIISKHFRDFKQRIILQKLDAHNILDEEYKNIRYHTIQEFEKYVEDNIDYIKSVQIVNYSITKSKDYNIYICKDQYGNTYIFKKMPNTSYTVQLDDYTLENEDFNKKYNEVNDRDKGILNVDKFFKMINMQDYTSAYKVLDEGFKQNYFKTQIDFENYMKNKVFRYNKVEYKEYSNKLTDIYTYKLELTDATSENQNQIEFNIVMKLQEGTNFVMSFEVN